MNKRINLALAALSCAVSITASPAQLDGKLPLYPAGRNLNEMPPAALVAGVPMVQETDDAVSVVDAWYQSNAPKTCERTAQSGGVKYKCEGGSIMIYAKGKTQIAFVPAFGTF